MAASLEETLTSVWQQVMIENARSVKLENRSFPVRRTSRSRLREVDFQFEGTNCAISKKVPRQHRAGQNWHDKEKKRCSFYSSGATLRLWWMERCASIAKLRYQVKHT